jgi:hypothetical protein
MNAAQLNAWHENKFASSGPGVSKLTKRNRASFVPALTIGSQPQGQGSSVALVNATPGDLINENSVPYVPGGYPQHLAPPGAPGTQQQQLQPQMTVPPWIAVPPCSGRQKPYPVNHIGLVGESSSNLNLPSSRIIVRRVNFMPV